MKGFMFGFVPFDDPQASEDRLFPAKLVLDVRASSRLREVRRHLGLTQADVARAAQDLDLRWNRSIVHAIERFGLVGDAHPGSEEGPEAESASSRPRPANPMNPQSGTRRMTLAELFAVPRILERACELRGIPYEPVHPLWFLPRKTFDGLEAALRDSSRIASTWPDVPRS